jgi:hypothetical protein
MLSGIPGDNTFAWRFRLTTAWQRLRFKRRPGERRDP